MRLPVDYFFGNQNMADAQGSAQLERDTGLTRQKLASAMGWKWNRLAHKIGSPETDELSHLFCSIPWKVDVLTHLSSVQNLFFFYFFFFYPFTARVLDGDFKVTLTFESVDEILWCDHSNESSLPVLSHDATCFSKFHKVKFGNLVEICFWLNLAVKGLNNVSIVHGVIIVFLAFKIKLTIK